MTEQSDSWLARRIRLRLEWLRKKPTPTSNEAGLGKDFIGDILRGRKDSVFGDNAQALADVLGVPTEFLTNPDFKLPDEGDGPGARDRFPQPKILDHVVEVPEYDIKVSAGGGYLVDREEVKSVWRFGRDYLEGELRLNPHHLAVVEVKGDSMEPTLRNGDRVLVDHSDKNPANPGVYVIWDSDATVVKRLEKIPASDPPKIVLISDNKNHHEYTVLAEYVTVIGRVVWFGRRM